MSGEIEFGELRKKYLSDRTEQRPKILNSRLDYMMQAIYGLMIGALVYLFLASTIFIVIQVVWLGIGIEELIQLLLISLLVMGVGSLVAGACGVLACMFVGAMNWALGYIFTCREAIIVSAGFVGFWFLSIAILPMGDWYSDDYFWPVMGYIHLGPVAACIVASISAGIWESRKTRKRYILFFDERGIFQFGLRQMLVVTAWMAIIAAISSAAGSYGFLILVLIWLLWQSLIVFLDARWERHRVKQAASSIEWQR